MKRAYMRRPCIFIRLREFSSRLSKASVDGKQHLSTFPYFAFKLSLDRTTNCCKLINFYINIASKTNITTQAKYFKFDIWSKILFSKTISDLIRKFPLKATIFIALLGYFQTITLFMYSHVWHVSAVHGLPPKIALR